MCLQGADHSVWLTPETTVFVAPPPLPPRPNGWDIARMVLAVPFYGAAMGLLGLGLAAFIVGNVTAGRRGR